MDKTYRWFASIHKGDIGAITESQPEHALTSNQIGLTFEQYKFLRGVDNLARAKTLIAEIESKIQEEVVK